jgi:peroxiredoxin
MNLEELKVRLCDLIESAYTCAMEEGHREIVHPFTILIDKDGDINYKTLRKHDQRQQTTHQPISR